MSGADGPSFEPWLKEFTLFLELPKELQIKIWKLLFPAPCLVRLRLGMGPRPQFFYLYTQVSTPVTSRVCFLSREETLKTYKCKLQDVEKTWPLYADSGRVCFAPTRDTLLLDLTQAALRRRLEAPPATSLWPYLEDVQHLRVVVPENQVGYGLWFIEAYIDPILSHLHQLKQLKSFVLVLPFYTCAGRFPMLTRGTSPVIEVTFDAIQERMKESKERHTQLKLSEVWARNNAECLCGECTRPIVNYDAYGHSYRPPQRYPADKPRSEMHDNWGFP